MFTLITVDLQIHTLLHTMHTKSREIPRQHEISRYSDRLFQVAKQMRKRVSFFIQFPNVHIIRICLKALCVWNILVHNG